VVEELGAEVIEMTEYVARPVSTGTAPDTVDADATGAVGAEDAPASELVHGFLVLVDVSSELLHFVLVLLEAVAAVLILLDGKGALYVEYGGITPPLEAPVGRGAEPVKGIELEAPRGAELGRSLSAVLGHGAVAIGATGVARLYCAPPTGRRE
jgi:hypothetical protein